MIMRTPGLLAGRVLEEVDSSVNGKIVVVRSMGLGTYFQVGNLTQSGGVVRTVWKTALGKTKKKKNETRKSLILGLGGGSAAGLIRHFWPEASVEGVDIDPVMVNLGKKYLGLEADKIRIQDAKDFLEGNKESYDLILVDMYIGDEYPKKFVKDEFLNLVKSRLDKKGTAIFNRLYYDEKRKEAVKFGEKLKKHFSEVERVYPEANLMFICSSV
jgi:spermidine synthase